MGRISELKEELNLLIKIKEIKKEIAELENKEVNQQIVYVPLPYVPWNVPPPYITWADPYSTGDPLPYNQPVITS